MNKYPALVFRIQKWINSCWFLLITLLFSLNAFSQSTVYNFFHITAGDGLSNGVVRNFTQDKYGYIWAGTLNGLCRYNGYSIKVFLHSAKDSFSIPDNAIQGLLCDDNKILRVSYQGGMYHYDYPSNRFIAEPACKGINIKKMVKGGPNIIYCTTINGLGIFNTSTGKLSFPAATGNGETKALLQRYLFDITVTKTGTLYLASDTGLIVYEPTQQKATLVPLKNLAGSIISNINIDKSGNVWISFGFNGGDVMKIDSSLTKYTLFPEFRTDVSNNNITTISVDNKGRVWVATTGQGICLYDVLANNFKCFGNNVLQANSISAYNITSIFQDKDGFIWLGTEGYGINYFHPDNNLFHSILPELDPTTNFTDSWSRAIAEDKEGNLWMGSVNGVACYNISKNSYSFLSNTKGHPGQLYSNSVRSILCDDHGYVWIGTALGLNRYNISSGHMDFFGEKDALPHSFFWSLLQDQQKRIWICSREGLFRFNYSTNTFQNFENDSLLSPFHSYNFLTVFQDSHKRMWFGSYKRGIVMLDEAAGTVKHWMKDATNPGFINNNIRSFAEDKDGIIWAATNEGLTAYNVATDKFQKYAEEEGLKSINVSGLMVDKRNRLWVGSGNGLYVLDSIRHEFKSFSLKDGLPSLELNDQSAFKTSKGDFIYPSLKGFLSFNPEQYKEKSPVTDIYLSGLKVFNKDYRLATNIEELTHLKLGYDENFFSLELTAFNYHNPDQTWYAYKLEPFDKEWIYTKERLINYTNVPGGSYTFRYKASPGANNWNVKEKNITIFIGTVFYKTIWFWILMLALVAILLYRIYKYRINQREKIYSLQTKAQALEKEKAIVQYESLKQQLNPHFLFNSLTSLRSLIRIDKKNAADFLDKMSLNYRYILKSAESELVPLKDELAFAQGYCDMQVVRFGKGLQVTIQVGEEQMYKKIVPVTIQNLVENAIKHNIIDDQSPLKIYIGEETGWLVVRNNLQPKSFVETSNQYGLKHLQLLYRYLDERPIIIEKTTDDFTIKIPLI
ncbi:MAG: two-component regulator propeller domain-containing protein [Ferruginibacter sp.]